MVAAGRDDGGRLDRKDLLLTLPPQHQIQSGDDKDGSDDAARIDDRERRRTR